MMKELRLAVLRSIIGTICVNKEGLGHVLDALESNDVIANNAKGMIRGVQEISHLQVRDCMVPRAQMVMIEHDQSPDAILEIVIGSKHSRFPVIDRQQDKVIGMLLAKDLLDVLVKPDKRFDLMSTLRQALFVPESKRLDQLLQEFQVSHSHAAVVVDEYGGISGLVTIEDAIEPIVGEIEDEHDVEDEQIFIQSTSSGRFHVKAATPIDQFNAHFESSFDHKSFDTIAGIIGSHFGYIPKTGEMLVLQGIKFIVVHADARRMYSFDVQVIADDASN